MVNKLINESSPYLLQHADNPVDWYPWGEEALEKARREDKPIFLSIGYAACHWCHVMEHESFEDHEIAAILNEKFVPIKVDREERPDLDSIYMKAVVAMTGHGGWPMSVFLTPDGKPFHGGTYFPPTPRFGMPSFRQVLAGVANAWSEQRSQLEDSGQRLAQDIQTESSLSGNRQAIQPQLLDQAAMALAQSYDWKDGGWGKAPKFPQPMAIEFLLRRAVRGDKFGLEIATHVLRAMSRGGLYDLVGGGFSRYSTDDRWLVPHFEKMLYDNGQLAEVYLHAYLLTGEAGFRQICEQTLEFIERELRHPQGGFFSSLDADSEGEEGKFYVWKPGEITAALGDGQGSRMVIAAYGITDAGNFEGQNVFQRALSDEELAERFGLPPQEIGDRLKDLNARLLEVRSQRIRPATDDKVLVSWNGLALLAFAEAARYLHRPDFLEIARQNAAFLLAALRSQGRLMRSWREGQTRHNAYLEDYASLILGLLALYQSDPDPHWFRSAVELAEDMTEHYRDPAGGFFDTRDDHEPLLTRPKEVQDNAMPSGNSMAAAALLLLSNYTARGDWRDMAEEMLGVIQPAAVRYPTAFARWLSALDYTAGPVQEVAILRGRHGAMSDELINVVWETYHPRLAVAISDFPPPPGSPPLLEDRPLLEGQPTAYVCQNFVCLQPVTQPDALRKQLGQGLAAEG